MRQWNSRGLKGHFCQQILIAAAAGLSLATMAFGENPNTYLGPDVNSPLLGPVGSRINIAKSQFGVDGSGVTLGQIEPNEPLSTHVALGGMDTVHNAGTAADTHATGVAGIMIGRNFTFTNPTGGNLTINGVASGASLFSTGTTGGFAANLNWLTGQAGLKIINMSAGFGKNNNNGNSANTVYVDQMVINNNVVFTKSAGNIGPGAGTITVPGDAYNDITVGRTGGDAAGNASTDYTQVYTGVAGSSQGPTGGPNSIDKPDIVAPGSLITMIGPKVQNAGAQSNSGWTPAQGVWNGDGGTSFAAPQVAGVAALLQQFDKNQGYIFSELSTKAEILNSASMDVRDPTTAADQSWPVWRAANYASVVLGDGVTQLTNSQPVSDSMGVGELNGLAALRQDVSGGRSDVGDQLNTVGANATTTSNLSVGTQLTAGSLVDATLTWNRTVNLTNPAAPANPASYTANALSNLNLSLVNNTTGDTVAISNSGAAAATGGDNVEHLYISVPTTGNYSLVVQNRSAVATPYAMDWTSGASPGISITVDNGTQGINALGANAPAAAWPNDVNSLGPNGPGNYPVGGEIFSSATNGTNQLRISGALQTRARVGPFNAPPAAQNLLTPASLGVLGMQAGDQMTGLSFGRDGSAGGPTGIQDAVLYFSVSPGSQGANRTAVASEFANQAQAGDIFKSMSFLPFGKYSSPKVTPADLRNNQIVYTGAQLGLKSGPQQDNLRDFEMDSVTSYVDPEGDGVNNAAVFFALSPNSPSITKSGGELTPNDIFVQQPQDNNMAFNPDTQKANFDAFSIYATAAQIGLQAGDMINSLILSDVGPNNVPDGVVQPFADMNTPFDTALFTLAPGSPTLAAFQDGSPGDVFYTAFNGSCSIYSFYYEMGLGVTDTIDGLDIVTVPEPVEMAMVAGLVFLTLRRRRVV